MAYLRNLKDSIPKETLEKVQLHSVLNQAAIMASNDEDNGTLNFVRLKEMHKLLNPRKKRPSDSPSKQKEKRQRRKESGIANSKVRGHIEFSCDTLEEKTILMNKIDHIKMILGGGRIAKVSNYALLSQVLDYYVESNLEKDMTKDKDKASDVHLPGSYQLSNRDSTNEPIFLSTKSAIDNLFNRLQLHSSSCPKPMFVSGFKSEDGHVGTMDFTCEDRVHAIHWYSSPRIEGGKFLVDARMLHGQISSGIQPAQYERFCNAANIGKIGDTALNTFVDSYRQSVHTVAEESQKDALMEEVASSEVIDDGIDIMTDARHCWRSNAKFSDVVCLGESSHKALRVETITKDDDKCSQRHEIIGTKRIYQYLDDEAVPVRIHAHDYNATVVKFVREERKPTRNGNDTWHATKNVAKNMKKKITQGEKRAKWYKNELSDKGASIKTHLYWSIKNCNNSPDRLRASIDNIIPHYQGDHQNCSLESRCRNDPLYEPSKEKIVTPKAEERLRKYLQSLPIYKSAQDYTACKDTHYVESFNNMLLIYHDKRIGGIGYNRYRMNTELSILDWNENIDRPRTSVRQVEEDVNHPRRKTGTPVHSKKKYSFRSKIWEDWMSKFYQ